MQIKSSYFVNDMVISGRLTFNKLFDFANNHTITAKFIEFKNPLKTSTAFNTIITYTS